MSPLHPEVQAFVSDLAARPGARPTHELSPQRAREAYRELVVALGPGEDVGAVRDLALPTPAGPLPVRAYTPRAAGPHPVLVFYHGGGFVIGDLGTHDRECRALCNAAGCLVLAVDYRLAPEHRFPAAVEDASAALAWLAEHAATLGGDPARIAVGGDSAGGTLAAVTALQARDAGGPALRLQLLVYPGVDARPGAGALYSSRAEHAGGPFLLRETVDYFYAHYFGGQEGLRADPRASPLLAASHAGLPPAFVATAECDVLRDEGEAYAAALEAAGVPVELRRYDGMPHVFFQLGPVVVAGRALLGACGAALRKAFA